MIYSKTDTVAANTLIDSPKQTKLPVTGGLVYQVDVYFPPGSSGLMGLIICDGGYQVWPSERGEWFFGDNHLISFKDLYYISSPNKVLDIYAYNLDDYYEHKYQVRVGMANDPAAISAYLPMAANESLASMIAELIAGQDQSYVAQQAKLKALAEQMGSES